jgi:hypothetical protein
MLPLMGSIVDKNIETPKGVDGLLDDLETVFLRAEVLGDEYNFGGGGFLQDEAFLERPVDRESAFRTSSDEVRLRVQEGKSRQRELRKREENRERR